MDTPLFLINGHQDKGPRATGKKKMCRKNGKEAKVAYQDLTRGEGGQRLYSSAVSNAPIFRPDKKKIRRGKRKLLKTSTRRIATMQKPSYTQQHMPEGRV